MKRKLAGFLVIAGSAVSLAPLGAFAIPESHDPSSIEKEVLRISRQLKPIPDEIWKTIAGTKGAEKYQIVSGDTLYDISNRLFGDPKYWPKIWSLNNPSITNPHLIRPGTLIAFMPGSGTDLPSVSVTPEAASPPKTKSDAGETPILESREIRSKHRSEEWSKLPKQRWEETTITSLDGVEQVGLGRDLKEKLKIMNSSVTFSLKSVAASTPITPLAEITAATKPIPYLSTGDKVFIRAYKEKLQVGQTYTATAPTPSLLISKRKELQGYSYRLMGNILILEERDGLFVGKVLSADHLIGRGNVLIPPPARIPILDPMLGPGPMKAGLLTDPEYSSIVAAQYKQVFVDRGSVDGLKPGMVFNVYQHEDPFTELTFSNEDIEKTGEIMVVQVSERFSAAIVLKSDVPLFEGVTAILTSDEKLVKKTKPLISEDELDKLDQDDSLNRNEKRELRQLEKWKGNPPSPTPNEPPAPAPSDTPLPMPSLEPSPAPTTSDAPPPSDIPPPPEPSPTAPIDTAPVPPPGG